MNSARQQYGLLISGLVALIIAWVSSYSNFVTIESHVISREQDQLLSLAESVAVNVSNHIGQIEAELEILGRDPRQLQLEHYYKIKRGEIYEVGLLDQRGQTVYAYPENHVSETLLEDYSALIRNPERTVGGIYHDAGQFFVHVLRPIEIEGEGQRVLYARIPIEWLYQLLIAPIRAGEKGYASVKDASGVIIMHPNRTDIGKDVLKQRKDAYPDFDWSELEALVEKQKQGLAGVGVYHSLWFTEDSSTRVKKFNAFAPARIGDSFWIVNISKDYDEVVDFLKYRTYGLWAINLSVLFVVLLALYFYDRLIKQKRALKVQETLSKEVGLLNEALQKDLIVKQRISEELEKRKEWYEAIFNGVGEGIALVNFDIHYKPHLILDANEPLASIFGFSKQQMLTMEFSQLVMGDQALDKIANVFREWSLSPSIESELGSLRFEGEGKHRSGILLPLEIECQWMRYADQWRGIIRLRDTSDIVLERAVTERAMLRFKGLLSEIAGHIEPDFLREVSVAASERQQLTLLLDRMNMHLETLYSAEVAENKKKEALMVYQSRMAAMGEMLANIAHQWRQPLSVMRMVFDNLKDAYIHGELDLQTIERQHERIEHLTQHMSRTIDDFRFFFKPQKSPKAFLVSHAIQMATVLVEEPIRHHHIHLELNIIKDVLLFNYESQLSHVFLAIAQNSIDSLIKCRESGRSIRVGVHVDVESVVVTFLDNGGGVPVEHESMLFEPYFSTKSQKKGMGLGLSIAKMIVEQHYKGTIQAKNHSEGLLTLVELPLRGAFDGENGSAHDERDSE